MKMSTMETSRWKSEDKSTGIDSAATLRLIDTRFCPRLEIRYLKVNPYALSTL
jgi:hypothetical protein